MDIKEEVEDETLDYTIVKEEYCIDERTSDSEKENGVVLDIQETVKYEITEIEQTDNVESEKEENLYPNHESYLSSYEFSQPPMSFLPPVPPERSFQCPQCLKTYATRKALNRHMKIHKEGVSFPCPICQKHFKTASYLRNHMIIHRERRHACEICGKKFIDRAHVNRHIRQMHESKKQVKKVYICQHCGKNLRDRCRYTNHMKVHEAKTIECPDPNCSLKFKYQHNLDKHMTIHSAEKPFPCPKCPRRFKTKAVLVNHMRIHENGTPILNCEICTKTFQWKRNLRKHMQEHSTAKDRLTCPHCFKSLWRKHLKIHIEKRHNERCLIDTKDIPVIRIKSDI